MSDPFLFCVNIRVLEKSLQYIDYIGNRKMTDKAKNGTASTATILAAAQLPPSLMRIQTTETTNKLTNEALAALGRTTTVVSSAVTEIPTSLSLSLSRATIIYPIYGQ